MPIMARMKNELTKVQLPFAFDSNGESLSDIKIDANMTNIGLPQTMTGTAPFTYTPSGSTLTDWSTEGNSRGTLNLFDYKTMVPSPQNAYLDESGDEVSNTNWAYTDFIPCDGADFVLSSVGGYNASICFYDSSKNFIFGQKYGTGTTGTKQSIFITVPETAKFVRFSYCYTSSIPQNIDDLTKIMLNSGSTALPYEPYTLGIAKSFGDKTANLFGGETNIYPNSSGVMVVGGTCVSSVFDISNITHITLNTNLELLNSGIFRVGLSNSPIVEGSTTTRVSCGNETIDVSEYTYVCIACAYNNVPGSDPEKILQATMVNTGSTSLPYEPYGYKITTSNSGQTQTVYLSEPLREIGNYPDSMQYSLQAATRKIGVITLTGDEAWTAVGEGSAIRFYTQDYRAGIMASSPAFCTDYTYGDATLYGQFEITAASSIMINRTGESFADFKLRLAERYADGNPVTIWYVLATPTTEQITIPQISTTPNTANTLSFTTELQPSSAQISYLSAGVPDPNAILYPQEFGDRTANLANLVFTDNYSLNIETGLPVPLEQYSRCATVSPFVYSGLTNVVLTFSYPTGKLIIYSVFNGDTLVRRVAGISPGSVIDLSGGNKAYFCLYNDVLTTNLSNIMLNTGSTALPYEPYGYKVSISNGTTTATTYLSESMRKIGDYVDWMQYSFQSATRKLAKLVITGKEDWILTSTNSHGIANFRYPGEISDRLAAVGNIVSSHLIMSTSGNADALTEGIRITAQNILYIRRWASDISTAAALKQWLSDQYTNGTPVEVWYVLAQETTEQITIPQITTENGHNTLSFTTELQPSDVQIKGEGLYTATKKILLPDGQTEVKFGADNNGAYFFKNPNYFG